MLPLVYRFYSRCLDADPLCEEGKEREGERRGERGKRIGERAYHKILAPNRAVTGLKTTYCILHIAAHFFKKERRRRKRKRRERRKKRKKNRKNVISET